MCGIGGFQLRQPANFNSEALLNAVQKKLYSRGPDSSSHWVNKTNTTGLCHTRLSIVDLSALGNQPMRTIDNRYHITFNGEIYNWRCLRKQLESLGETFRSNSDTEVVLHGYRRWGVDILQKLRGMFAFALWDEIEQVLICARDRIGKKPFVYGENGEGFFFSSELPGLNTMSQFSGLNLSINHSGLASMMLHNLRHIPEPATVYSGCHKLRPGHAICVKYGKIIKHWRYWQPTPRPIQHPSELRAILEEAVSLRSIADVPVAALLSGGLDSTALVALMQNSSAEPLRTYAFGLDKNDEDLVRARFVSERIGTQHKEFYFDPQRQFNLFKRIIDTQGEPIMLLPLVHAYEMSEAIHDDGIKVVMNGNGADELFFGYKGHLKTAQITKLWNRFGWLTRLLPQINHSRFSVLSAQPGKRKSEYYRRKAEMHWPSYINQEMIPSLENIACQEMAYWGEILPNNDFIDESNYISLLIENSHSITIASDLPGMMASIEMRSPFLDQEIIAAAMGIHFSQKVKGPKDGSQLKQILRKTVSDLVPNEVLNASKRGFGFGIQEKDLLTGAWFQEANKMFNNFPEMGLFDSRKVRQFWENSCRNKQYAWSDLAKLFAIGTWFRESKV